MQISTYQNQNGSITITAGMRNLVNGTQTNTLSTQLNANGDEDLSLDGVDITGSITTGQLGGDIAARNTIESGSLLDLSKLVASLTVQTNSLQSSGYGLDGSTGNNFFTPLQLSTQASSANATITANITDPSQLTLDGYNISFDATASNYTVTDEQTGAVAAAGAYTSGSPIVFDGIQVTITGPVAPTDTFSVSPLTNAIQNFGVAITDPNQIAAASSNTALPGDNTNATAIANLAQSSISTLGNSTFSDYYNGLVAQVGTQSAAASNSLTFDNNLLTQIQTNQQSVSGVNLDDEATNLLQYERSYEASAQIIKVTDELVQTVIGMVSAV
jgi:flagellar hook-associated protein 1 FlgK